MAHHVGQTGHVVGDIALLAAGWAFPTLLNIGLTDIADYVIPTAQVSTSLLVLITALIRYKKAKKDQEKEDKTEE